MAWDAPDQKFFGYLYAPSAGIDYRPADHVYFGYRFYMDFGNISSGSCKRDFEDMFMQARLGFTLGRTFLVTPYTGLGVNIATQKRQHVLNACKQLAFVDVEVPVGAILSYHPSPRFSVGIDYQCLFQVDSWERMTGFYGIRFQRSVKSQQCVELPIQFTFGDPRWESVQYRLIPFFRTYRYGTTTVTSPSGGIINLQSQKAYEFGIRYEIAIW